MLTKICPLDDIPPLGSRVIEREGKSNIAVFRTSTNTVFALVDKCPHRGGLLSQGMVHGKYVTCPLHQWTIHLDTGKAKEPDEGNTKCFKTLIEDNTVLVDIDD